VTYMDRTGHSLPPPRPRRWRFSRLPLGHRTQARTDQKGEGIKPGSSTTISSGGSAYCQSRPNAIQQTSATRSYRSWGRTLIHPTMRRERR
jgi:hypothetical protein